MKKREVIERGKISLASDKLSEISLRLLQIVEVSVQV